MKKKGNEEDGVIEPLELTFHGDTVDFRVLLERLSNDCDEGLPQDYLTIWERRYRRGESADEAKESPLFSTSAIRIELVEGGMMLQDSDNGFHLRFVLSAGNEHDSTARPEWPDPLTLADTSRMITVMVYPDRVEIVE